MKLSTAQRAFLAEFAREGYRLAPGGYAGAAQAASAFYRTGESLKKMGLVVRPVGSPVYYLTMRGLAWAVEMLP